MGPVTNDETPTSQRDGDDTDVHTGGALVSIETAETATAGPLLATTRHDAPFLTQLIATAEHEPQTRQLRRAASDTAVSAYRAAVKPPAAATGHLTRQSF